MEELKENEEMEGVRDSKVYVVRTTIGQERSTADMIVARARNFDLPIRSVLVPQGIRGYVFVEGRDRISVERARMGIKHAKGVIRGEVPLNEIENLLVPKSTVTGMEIGDIVELTAGPFKGERARIIRIDESKEEITIELFEATVPIPVTVRGDSIKIVERRKEE